MKFKLISNTGVWGKLYLSRGVSDALRSYMPSNQNIQGAEGGFFVERLKYDLGDAGERPSMILLVVGEKDVGEVPGLKKKLVESLESEFQSVLNAPDIPSVAADVQEIRIFCDSLSTQSGIRGKKLQEELLSSGEGIQVEGDDNAQLNVNPAHSSLFRIIISWMPLLQLVAIGLLGWQLYVVSQQSAEIIRQVEELNKRTARLESKVEQNSKDIAKNIEYNKTIHKLIRKDIQRNSTAIAQMKVYYEANRLFTGKTLRLLIDHYRIEAEYKDSKDFEQKVAERLAKLGAYAIDFFIVIVADGNERDKSRELAVFALAKMKSKARKCIKQLRMILDTRLPSKLRSAIKDAIKEIEAHECQP